MSEKRDYYEVLGVAKDVDERTLKKAYHKLAMQFHPDKNPDDKAAEDKFKEASEAYDVLSDADKRAHYDRFGHNAPNLGGGVSAQQYASNLQDIFGDLFADFFGGGRRRGASRGSDLRFNLEVTFEEAAFGVQKEIQIPRLEDCETCHGTGAKPGTTVKTCQQCGGAGEVRIAQGFFAIAQTCRACGGQGKTIEHPCTDCRGNGQTQQERGMSVKIPPGCDDGTRLRFVGEGEAGRGGGPRGDLYVVLSIEEHPLFSREDQDVICEVPLSFPQAALGCSLEVPTLDGKVTMKVPAGTQPGGVFRLRGKGIPHMRGSGRGDQLVKVKVEVPRKLSDEQRDILERFAATLPDGGGEVHPENKGFFDKVKELFG